jgi:hypothetical protein
MLNNLTQLATNPAMSIVSAIVTPAILILAAGSIVASTVVRLGRVADHTRALIIQCEAARREGKTRAVEVLEARMGRQLKRAELTRNALWGYYFAIVLFLISSVAIALSQVFHMTVNWIGPSIVLLGGLVMIVATSQLVIEVGLSAGLLRHEIQSYKDRELES